MCLALHVQHGDVESLPLSVDQRDTKNLKVKQDVSLLTIERIEADHQHFSSDPKVHATLVVKKLTSLHLNAAAAVTFAPLTADPPELAIDGASSIDLQQLHAASVELPISGA